MDFATVAAAAAANMTNDCGIGAGGGMMFGHYDVVDNAKNVHTAQFVCPEEEEAVTAILMACQNVTGSPLDGAYYVERDDYGHVISLMDVGKAASPSPSDHENNSAANPPRQQHPLEWDMPSAVGRLLFLQKLTVYHCRSLPPEIGYCSQLRELSFKFCHSLQALPTDAFAFLANLTDLRIHGPTGQHLRIVPSIKTLPGLKYLYCRASCPHGGSRTAPTAASAVAASTSTSVGDGSDRPYQIGFHVEDLLDDFIAFRNTLELLEIEGARLTERHVATLFGTVMPHFPHLQRVFLPNNHIRSLGPLVDATRRTILVRGNGKQLPSTVRIRALNLLGNPVLQFATYGQVEDQNAGETHPEPTTPPTQDQHDDLSRQQENLLELVTLHEELSNLGFGFTESALCTTDILLMLDLNDAGRALLLPPSHEGGDDDDEEEEKQTKPRFPPIPLSVWPTVLERAHGQKGYHPSINVVYYLLRYGPVLLKEEGKNRKRSKRTFATRSIAGGGHDLRYHHKRKAADMS